MSPVVVALQIYVLVCQLRISHTFTRLARAVNHSALDLDDTINELMVVQSRLEHEVGDRDPPDDGTPSTSVLYGRVLEFI